MSFVGVFFVCARIVGFTRIYAASVFPEVAVFASAFVGRCSCRSAGVFIIRIGYFAARIRIARIYAFGFVFFPEVVRVAFEMAVACFFTVVSACNPFTFKLIISVYDPITIFLIALGLFFIGLSLLLCFLP